MPIRAARAIQRHNVHVLGRGRQAIVFAHGFGCDQAMWRHVVPAFADTHRVVLFDHAGCGGADPAAYDWLRHASLEGYADDVVELAEALDWQDMVFVGHSVSAIIGALAAVRCPERFARLVMVCPSPRYADDPPHYTGGFSADALAQLVDGMTEDMNGWADGLARAAVGAPAAQHQVDELKHKLCAMDPVVLRRFARATFEGDHRGVLARVTVPTLVLQVAVDAVAPLSVGIFCHQQLRGSRLEVLQAVGHCPHLTHPALTIDAIRRYLDRAAP